MEVHLNRQAAETRAAVTMDTKAPVAQSMQHRPSLHTAYDDDWNEILPGPPPRASMVAQSTRPLDGVESDMPGRYEAKPPPRAADIAAAVRALG